MQTKEVKVDLKVSRRESGLTQADVAQLLNTSQPRISNLEGGKSVLTVEEMVKLAIVFNKSATRLFRLLSERLRREVAKQLANVSPEVSNQPNAELRQKTLSRLAEQLQAKNTKAYE